MSTDKSCHNHVESKNEKELNGQRLPCCISPN